MQDKINLTAKGHNITVTSKSLIIDEKEYLYKGISEIKHASSKQVYAFKYEGKWQRLDYDDDSQKKVVAVFAQIANLIKKRRAAEKKAAEEVPAVAEETPIVEPVAEPVEETPVEVTPVEEIPAGDEPTVTIAEEAAEVAAVEEVPAEEVAEEAPAEEAGEEAQAEDVAKEAGEEAQAEDVAKEAGEEAQAEGAEAEQKEESTADPDELTKALLDVEGIEPDDTEVKRKSKLKKAIIVLIIVLAVFLAAGVAYFFILGPSLDASQSPNTDSTHQYNDIEELIDEMQE